MNAIPLPNSRIKEILARLDTFHDVAPDTLEQLAAGTRQIALRRDEPVFHKGMPPEVLHVVVSGQVKLFMAQANAGERVLALVEHGECIDVASVWQGEPYLVNAAANKDSHLLCIDRPLLLRLARADCGLASRLLDAVSLRIGRLMRNMENCLPRSAQQRVACYLTQHRPHPSGPVYEVFLPSTKRDIAAKLNLTQETFSRVLRQLKEEGVIEVSGRSIRVLSIDRLMTFNPAS